MIPTLIGITMLAFAVMQTASKHAYQAELDQLRGRDGGEAGGGGGGAVEAGASIGLEQEDLLKKSYELHLPILFNSDVRDRSSLIKRALEKHGEKLPDVDTSTLLAFLEQNKLNKLKVELTKYLEESKSTKHEFDFDVKFEGRFTVLAGSVDEKYAIALDQQWEAFRGQLKTRTEFRKDLRRASNILKDANYRLLTELMPDILKTEGDSKVLFLANLKHVDGLGVETEEGVLDWWAAHSAEFSDDALQADAELLITGQRSDADYKAARARIVKRRQIYAEPIFDNFAKATSVVQARQAIGLFELASGCQSIPYIEKNEWSQINNSWDEATKWWRDNRFEFTNISGLDEAICSLTQTRYGGWLNDLLHGDMRQSRYLGVPVSEALSSRLQISVQFGLTGFLLSYLVCIPLGVMKAVKHNTTFDVESSIIVFIGYSIPGWALGAILLMIFSTDAIDVVIPFIGEIEMPLRGHISDNYYSMSFWDRVWDRISHAVLPVCAYAAGSFATLTVLMKNSLMENLGADYVRTAFAKGLSERRVIFGHALRNSLIPLLTGLGHMLSIVISGSYLIEMVFTIDGFGYMGFQALMNNDINLLMGVLFIASVLKVFGNLFSDILYSFADPRIRFK